MNTINSLACLLLIAVSYVNAAPYSGGIGGLVRMGNPEVRIRPEVIAKFATIEDHLKRHVESEDIETNMLEVERWLKKKDNKVLSIFKDKDLVEALNIFTSISSVGTNCEDATKALKAVDKALMDDVHQAGGNYPFKRVDKIVEHYGWNIVKQCNAEPQGFLKLVLKKNTFDELDAYLESNGSEDDAEANMAKLTELLDKTEAESGEGAWTEAIRLIKQLETIQSDGSCSKDSLEIMRKNLRIAGKSSSKSYEPKSRLEKLVFKYAHDFAKKCQQQLPGKFSETIDGLSSDVSHPIRVLMDETILQHIESDEVDEQFRREFTTPELVKFAAEGGMKKGRWFREADIYKTLEVLAASNSEDSKSLKMQVDEQTGEEFYDEQKLLGVYHKYLVEPCGVYLEKTNDFFYEYYDQFAFYRGFNDEVHESISEFLPLIVGHEANDRCRDVLFFESRGYFVERMTDIIKTKH